MRNVAIPAPVASPSSMTTAASIITITIPQAQQSGSAARHATYVSTATNSMVLTPQGQTPIVMPVTTTTPGCRTLNGARICTFRISLPTGTYAMRVALYATADGTGFPLATVSTTTTIVPNTTNNLDFTLNAVVSAVSIALTPDSVFASGTAATKTINVGASDAGGAIIVVGTDALVDSNGSAVTIHLVNTDTSGATSIFPQIADASPSTLSYNGAASAGGTVTATAVNSSDLSVTSAHATFTVSGNTVCGTVKARSPLSNSCSLRTDVAYYQPTPYGSGTLHGTHLLDGWLPSVFDGQTFQNVDGVLQIGGFGDIYRTYVQFDLAGLPYNVADATLELYSYSRGDNSTLVAFDVRSPNNAWAASDSNRYLSTTMTWNTQPLSSYVGTTSAGAINSFWSVPITALYNGWQSNPNSNNGLELNPLQESNNFDVWRSSRYAFDGDRPLIRFTFLSGAPVFKMPLPRGVSWLVTTEVGGYDCTVNNPKDPAHDGLNYFSVDFSWSNKDANGNPVFTMPTAATSTIPITPAADGIVTDVDGLSLPFDGPHYVVVSHDPSGLQAVGYSTRYLHLHDPPPVIKGQKVFQGSTVLGYMGIAGTGPHLHFGMRYGDGVSDVGYSSTQPLSYALVSGWLMKSFQTECLNGHPNRFYLSG
jgi:murein DD-endopeptidase MepM/ murein hydrolase activator NlpD